jgi:hypothetical protein
LKQAAVGTLSRTGNRALEVDAITAEVSGEPADVARLGSPAYESRLGQLLQIAHVWRSGLLGVRRNDFEIVPVTEREKRITGPAARMNAAERRADTSVLFDECHTAVEIVAAEKNMIKHGRRTDLSQRESWGDESASS